MMKTTLKAAYILLTVLLGAALVASPVAFAATGMEGGTETLAISIQNVEDKIDCVASYMRVEKEMDVPEDFKYTSGMMDILYGRADATGNIATQVEDADMAVNEVIVQAAQNLLTSPDLTQQDRMILEAILALIDEVPQGYCDPEAFEEEPAPDEVPVGRNDPEDDPYRTPEATGNFEYYGKDDYILPDATTSTEPGRLDLASDDDAPFIAPLWVYGINEPVDTGDYSSAGVSQNLLGDPKVNVNGDSFVRYSWIDDTDKKNTYSATLHMDPNSDDSDYIVFSYGDLTIDSFWDIFVGISPGSGAVGHPGEGLGRQDAPQNLSDLDWQQLALGSDDYYKLFELFGPSQEKKFDLSDSFIVFGQDGDNKYRISAGTRQSVADTIGLDNQVKTSIDIALEELKNDPNLVDKVNNGDFTPDQYEYGLQTRGPNGEIFQDLAEINSDPLLAYMVQVEEHRLNQEMIRMAQNQDLRQKAQQALANADFYNQIKELDAAMTIKCDAQSGRVTKDHDGNWVRAQQYVIRSDDNQTVQLLNVSARGQDASNPSQISTMDFRTTVAGQLPGDLRDIPWEYWMDTQNDGYLRYVRIAPFPHPGSNLVLSEMSVEFQNVDNGTVQDSLKEYRGFASQGQYGIPIETETLTINGLMGEMVYNYIDANNHPALPWVSPPDGYYQVKQGVLDENGNPDSTKAGFHYDLGGGTPINVALYEAYDMGEGNATPTSANFKDMWDVLRVNEASVGGLDPTPNINDKNLEISINNSQYFNNPIEVIYIPMSRMWWGPSDNGNQTPS